ncbi:hypothetical protein E2C01_009008 [Portunus trituberculatus]|uniref:Uncharacterized protein n=1 Tax=Portunus trituberculatus TaxID=210409 RepID=A0A5B7D3G3_PORTR|nr:hypothetical protein [Portunus trituberculatus]
MPQLSPEDRPLARRCLAPALPLISLGHCVASIPGLPMTPDKFRGRMNVVGRKGEKEKEKKGGTHPPSGGKRPQVAVAAVAAVVAGIAVVVMVIVWEMTLRKKRAQKKSPRNSGGIHPCFRNAPRRHKS